MHKCLSLSSCTGFGVGDVGDTWCFSIFIGKESILPAVRAVGTIQRFYARRDLETLGKSWTVGIKLKLI
jgi:hypothetical protein